MWYVISNFLRLDAISTGKSHIQNAYGIKLPAKTVHKRKLLRNCVLPEMGLYILNQVEEQN